MPILNEDISKVLRDIADVQSAQQKAEEKLNEIRLSNAQKLAALQIEQINRVAAAKIAKEQAVNERLINMGFEAAQVANNYSFEQMQAYLKKEKEVKLKQAKQIAKATGKSIQEVKNDIEEEFAFRTKKAKEFNKAQKKEQDKQNAEQARQAANIAKETLGGIAGIFGVNNEAARNKVKDYLRQQGVDEKDLDAEANKALRNAKLAQTFEAMASFAKQLGQTTKEIGNAKSQIDTRLQGSRNKNVLGSYWELMQLDVTRNVGMNPFVKQADVVTNLKTLVGKGISFNVEQRAFLQTISDKIATTFDATDATLVKLVRIQQADSTAARLGMESALTSFLNNMYETTEYMTDAAKEIRQNLYEASALMGATQGVAFEYQVQKWMGSLYSVGFGNTSGLSAALGKLAAGDISGITGGGFGNLLIMAANRANLSIADILANGLDDSETNMLMKSMVEYLQDIYSETRNSRVVAQQYASVFGLTASDLKAAANLYGSTNTISKNSLGYGGMIGRLYAMANTMMTRTSIGEMMTNVFDNLKFATASQMAMNPVLYATYTIADMLEDTAGGVPIQLPTYMGTGMPQTIKISDIMRVATVGTGLLGGIATMLSGLGSLGTNGMMLGFGVNGGLTTLTRGNGTGIAAISGAGTSLGGYIGNNEGGDVQNKMLSDTKDNMNNQVAEASEESTETKLSTVDEHIVQIYDLLDSVVLGTKSLKVDMGDVTAWSNVMGRLG